MKRFALSAFAALTLPACFLSHDLDEGCGPNPCEGAEVASCSGLEACEALEWCGETLYCDYESPCAPPVCAMGESASEIRCEGESDCRTRRRCGEEIHCRPLCDGLRPVCADSIEVISCEGWTTCFTTEWCGETLHCASGDCSDPVFDPCPEATSMLLSSGLGTCPVGDLDSPCYESSYCGRPTYCVTACPQGAEQVAGPQDCESPDDCYWVDHGRDDLPLFWCQGNGPACRAVPTCDGEEISLDAPCPLDAVCEYRTLCSTTIQCVQPLLVPG